MLHACDSNTEEYSTRLRSILGVLPCLILRIWRLRARTKDECTMDNFSKLTIREPWLLKRKVSTSTVSTWLAGKESMLQDRQDSRQGPIGQGFPIGHYEKGMLMTEFHKLLYERWLQVGTSRNNLAHIFTYFADFGFWQLVVSKVQHPSKLMQCICLCGMVLMMHVRMTRLPICVDDWKCNQ
jgi:hypothetical protein